MAQKKTTTKATPDRKPLVDSITSRTKAIALIALIVEALFLVGVYALPVSQRISAFYLCIAVLAATVLGLIWLENRESPASISKKANITGIHASPPPKPPKYQIDGGRAAAIVGKWKGKVHQFEGPDGNPVDGTVSFTFEVNGTSVTGEGLFVFLYHGDEIALRFDFSGGFLYGQFLRFEFDRVDEHIVNFGSIILRLSDDASLLKGLFHGYGAKSGRIVSGTLEQLQKSEAES